MSYLNPQDSLPEVGDTVVQAKHTQDGQYGRLQLYFASGTVIHMSTFDPALRKLGKPQSVTKESK